MEESDGMQERKREIDEQRWKKGKHKRIKARQKIKGDSEAADRKPTLPSHEFYTKGRHRLPGANY